MPNRAMWGSRRVDEGVEELRGKCGQELLLWFSQEGIKVSRVFWVFIFKVSRFKVG